MSWERELFIGQRFWTPEEGLAILNRFGAEAVLSPKGFFQEKKGHNEPEVKITFEFEGTKVEEDAKAYYPDVPNLYECLEGHKRSVANGFDHHDSTSCWVGFEVISLLAESAPKGGYPDPFDIDPERAALLLKGVKAVWPEAKLFLGGFYC